MKEIKLTFSLLAFTLFLIPQITSSQTLSIDKFVDVSVDFVLPCTGEDLVGTVTLHDFIVYNKDGKIFKSHVQPQGGKLIGQTSGIVYNAVGVSQEKETLISSGETKTWSGIDNFHLVGIGKDGVKYKAYLKMHYTINSNGELTVDDAKNTITCE